jgi:hypothetical protein
MKLVLCSSNDVSAHWAFNGLKRRGVDGLEIVYSESLPFSLTWEHRLNDRGAMIRITLPDGRLIDGDEVDGMLNRMMMVPALPAHHSPDADYANQEFSALFLSWLYSIPGPVINRATPQGLCGQWRHISEWVWLAGRAGLPVQPYRQSSSDQINEMITERRLFPYGTPTRTLIAVNDVVCGAELPLEAQNGCTRLTRLAGTSLLGIELAQTQKQDWVFAGATPMPDLRYGGEAFLNQLASALGVGDDFECDPLQSTIESSDLNSVLSAGASL